MPKPREMVSIWRPAGAIAIHSRQLERGSQRSISIDAEQSHDCPRNLSHDEQPHSPTYSGPERREEKSAERLPRARRDHRYLPRLAALFENLLADLAACCALTLMIGP